MGKLKLFEEMERFVRGEKWELYGTQLAVTVKTLGQGKNNVRGEEKCEEMDRGGWFLFFKKEDRRLLRKSKV